LAKVVNKIELVLTVGYKAGYGQSSEELAAGSCDGSLKSLHVGYIPNAPFGCSASIAGFVPELDTKIHPYPRVGYSRIKGNSSEERKMKFDLNPQSIAMGLASVGVATVVAYALGQRSVIVMAPAPDNKAEQAYRRNGFGDKIMSQERRKALSTCYKTMLRSNGYDEARPTPKPGTNPETAENFEGKVTFVFHVAEDGALNKFKLAESDFRDSKFTDCISNSLAGLRFLPPPLGINRFLAHEFVFKSDETFKREMEERKNQAPLTLVTATPGAGVDDVTIKK
jgi:hypothetical protein